MRLWPSNSAPSAAPKVPIWVSLEGFYPKVQVPKISGVWAPVVIVQVLGKYMNEVWTGQGSSMSRFRVQSLGFQGSGCRVQH